MGVKKGMVLKRTDRFTVEDAKSIVGEFPDDFVGATRELAVMFGFRVFTSQLGGGKAQITINLDDVSNLNGWKKVYAILTLLNREMEKRVAE